MSGIELAPLRLLSPLQRTQGNLSSLPNGLRFFLPGRAGCVQSLLAPLHRSTTTRDHCHTACRPLFDRSAVFRRCRRPLVRRATCAKSGRANSSPVASRWQRGAGPRLTGCVAGRAAICSRFVACRAALRPPAPPSAAAAGRGRRTRRRRTRGKRTTRRLCRQLQCGLVVGSGKVTSHSCGELQHSALY